VKEVPILRRLIELDKDRRDLAFTLAQQYGSLLPDVLDILEIFEWDNGKASAALAARRIPSGGRLSDHVNSKNTDQGRS
jgi:hypothetical protein